MLTRLTRRLLKNANRLRVPAIASSVQRARLTYLSDEKFISLRDAIRQVRREKVPGDFIEYGIALGGSAIYIASELDDDRHFHGYDVFGMIPSPTEEDDEKSKARYDTIRSGRSKGIGGDTYYGYQGDLFDKVSTSFMDFGVPVDGARIVFHKGLFEDTVHFHPKSRIALAHLDCDWYDPVKLCLERTVEVLSPGGLMILDDYNDYGGCRTATDKFLAGRADCRLVRTLPHAVVQRI
ncbi:MAG: asparagine synthase [Mesorhizobium sp.]|nr:asparagine synthase [Mesorhizobium sp. M5C.F.Cr.IN.023.01.1.1]RWF87869.1 MAG: asparagine synthase [Mesorhizobium sp.]RWF96868.1 MAG: asparagine synthase [Mesorhizobium sp.]RWI41798.1 MAG: asparagine synthase [Mesorhizobium sp.]RWI50959.1 MAG: asparagine synthase [Mesorhizobium sp.]